MSVLNKILYACMLLAFFNSCKDDDPKPERSNYVEAKVNGALWSPGSFTCILLVDGTYNFRIFDLTATSGGKTITVEASDNATGGTMNTGSRTLAVGSAFFGYHVTGAPYHAISGTVNISEVEASASLVTGTFDFTVEDNSGNQVHVSDGKFVKVGYTVKNQ